MGREIKHLGILFADIAKSTQIYEKLGNVKAQALVSKSLMLLAICAVSYKGKVIKTIGDEIMCSFPTAVDAIDAAKEMHESLAMMSVKEFGINTRPNIYIGVEFGAVILENDDVFGDAVNVAARMVSKAKQRQTLTTEDTLRKLSPKIRDSARCIDTDFIKGKSGKFKIYEIVWEPQDVTIMMKPPVDQVLPQSYLEIVTNEKKVRVDQDRPVLTIGRQTYNDIVINSNRISRSHTRIEYRKGRFVLIDQSTNGTYVHLKNKYRLIRRDEIQLLGDGYISLGETVDPDSVNVIRFSVS
jgi:adenylate cyclase